MSPYYCSTNRGKCDKQHVPLHKHNIYKMKELLYLETDASGVSLSAGLLQVKKRMWLLKEEAANISLL